MASSMMSSMMKATSKGDTIDILRDILLLDPSCITQVNGQSTPLMSAAKYGRVEVTEFLIASGAHVDDVDRTGKTALSIATNHGHLKIVELLVSTGADINHQDQQGMTPLMIASQSGRLILVEFLLLNGADKNILRKDSKKAIDLVTSSDIRTLLSENLRNLLYYEAIYVDGSPIVLKEKRFTFPSEKLKCVKHVTTTDNISVILKCSTNFEMIRKESDIINCILSMSMDEGRHRSTKGKDIRFIQHAKENMKIITFRRITDVSSISSTTTSATTAATTTATATVTTIPSITCTDKIKQQKEMTDATANNDNSIMKNNNNNNNISENTVWYGILLEKGLCDLHRLCVELASNRNEKENDRKNIETNVKKNNNNKNDNDRNAVYINKTKQLGVEGDLTENNQENSNLRLFHDDDNKFRLALNFAVQVAHVLSCLHDFDFVWVDLKPSNFVVFMSPYDTEDENQDDNEGDKEDVKEDENNKQREEQQAKKEKKEKKNKTKPSLQEISYKILLRERTYIKAIDLGGCIKAGTKHDPKTLAFTVKFVPPELAVILKETEQKKAEIRRLEMVYLKINENAPENSPELINYLGDTDLKRRKIENMPNSCHQTGNDINFHVGKSFDSWSLGMLILQLFNSHFSCYFTDTFKEFNHEKNDNKNDENDNDENDNNGNYKNDNNDNADSKVSDIILERLSQRSDILQKHIDHYLYRFGNTDFVQYSSKPDSTDLNPRRTADSSHSQNRKRGEEKYNVDCNVCRNENNESSENNENNEHNENDTHDKNNVRVTGTDQQKKKTRSNDIEYRILGVIHGLLRVDPLARMSSFQAATILKEIEDLF